jgi:AcrR family transcriptional regulator
VLDAMTVHRGIPTSTRREQAIGHAVDLLREGGRRALTSVAVAERMGVTQSAVYRHIRNMDELAELATTRLIDELNSVLERVLLDPDIDWEEMADVARLCRLLVDAMVAKAASFAAIDARRFADDDLGVGIARIVEEGRDLVAGLLESRWRIEFGHEAALSDAERAAVLRHGQVMYDEALAVARLARSLPEHLDLDAVAGLLRYRVLGGWSSFVIDMNARVGLPFPSIDLDPGVVVD